MRRRLSVTIVTCGSALLVAHALYLRHLFHGHAVDDACISYRYASNLARGWGLVFNAGERVEGYSNFLWTVLLTPVAALGGDLVLTSQVLGLAHPAVQPESPTWTIAAIQSTTCRPWGADH